MIAISAKKRHGKDTVADYICQSRGYTKYALASVFKELLPIYLHYYLTPQMVEGNGYDRESMIFIPGQTVVSAFKIILSELGYHASIYTVDWEPIQLCNQWSVRKLMQTIGTDIGCNQVDKLIWMHNLAKKIWVGQSNLVISDCRQEHEMSLMRQFGATVIHVVNPLIKNTDEHITEAGLAIEPFDIVIYNDYDPSWPEQKQKESLNKLHMRIEAVLDELKI